MPDPARRLPPGKHGLTPEQVAADQRRRILRALADVMAEKGYAQTTISDIIKVARVSRPTFYSFFESKQDCFLAGYHHVQQAMIDGVLATPTAGTSMERFEDLLTRYLDTLASNPATAQLYLVHTYQVGPEAIHRRMAMQQRFVDVVSAIFAARSKADRFACTALVAAIATLVTDALVDQDTGAILALRAPVLDVARRLMAPTG
jgi:TetR/AcrR family transcriptional regulator